MRTEHNPLRSAKAPYRIKDIICLVVTHIPCEEVPGYHAQRLEVVQTCLNTMRNGIHRDHTFMVWDNGSNSTFRDWLQHIFEPDVLVMSQNIGKNPARKMAIDSMPHGSIVCYSDDDMYYEDDWFNPQYELLLHFPGVTLVSGYPAKRMFRWGTENTIAWAKKNAKVKHGQLIPEEWERDYAASVGMSWEHYLETTNADEFQTKITYNGKEAFATGHHAQFIGYQVKLRDILFEQGNAMGDEKPFDIAADRVGLRLCTTKRLVRHIGNVLDDSFKEVKK